MRRPVVFAALAIVAWAWVAAIAMAPRLDPAVAAFTYLTGSMICHQRPERSFHLDGAQLPVCARCSGLYLGGAIGVALWPLAAGVRRRTSPRMLQRLASPGARNLLVALAIPTVLSVATSMAGLWDPHNLTRALLALPLGGGLGALVVAAAAGDLR